jgi:hypothetical protein
MESADCGSETQDQQPKASWPKGKQRDDARAEDQQPEVSRR